MLSNCGLPLSYIPSPWRRLFKTSYSMKKEGSRKSKEEGEERGKDGGKEERNGGREGGKKEKTKKTF
jgi:hypothetical protein